MTTLPRALRTLLVLCFAATLSVACANTDAGSGTVDSGTGGSDAGTGGTDTGTTGGTDTGTTGGGDTGSTGGQDTGGGGGGATELTAKQVLEMAQKAQAKVKTCPQFVNPPAGKKIAVKGLVIVSPVYKASATLEGVFVQAKGGGAWSGLRLVGDKGKSFKDLKIGDTIDIEGQLVVFYCETQVSVTKVTKTSAAVEMPASVTVTLADVGEAATPEKANSYEAAFVSLKDVVVAKKEALGTDGKPHGEFWIGKSTGEQGLMVKADLKWPVTFYTYDKDTKKWATKLTDGQKLKSVRGIMTYSFEHWKLMPLSDDMLDFDTSK